jgi:hypothetical protein
VIPLHYIPQWHDGCEGYIFVSLFKELCLRSIRVEKALASDGFAFFFLDSQLLAISPMD